MRLTAEFVADENTRNLNQIDNSIADIQHGQATVAIIGDYRIARSGKGFVVCRGPIDFFARPEDVRKHLREKLGVAETKPA